ncbi:BOI-related E3 ubiquitin-protein ligase 1-like isoform X2 [Magnolia sinica]|uniref:BOI-related E3 ubiquitin-protein ligase 1-like isoform X2 n=1 Tax=Magnolia sinica TaxID=86752 RepID=UPI00265ABD4E|nr:BOI-related E3 ubiquitin-protein ligase 1-like isoform X2 [Magnolia sinica]
MAVQAQYPSNVLLLNRNGQDRKNMLGGDYSLQGQAGGLLDQSQMLFSSGGVNPRKRGREAVAAGGATPINLFALQPPPHPTLVNLAQLQNQQQAVVSTGLRLSFEDHQQQQQQQQQMGLLLPSSNLSSVLSEDLSAQIKRQRDEIDQFLQAQGDQLRRTLAERRQRHYRALLSAAEESAARRLREKDADVEKASRRNAELEERVAQLKAEAQVWQARARAQEATAASLQSQLQQAMMGGVGLGAQDRREDAGCAGGELPADDAESAHIDPGRVVSSVPPCRTCWKRAMTVVLLPCRHLCVCTNCDSAIDVCPICNSVRSASVEVYLS